MEEKTTKRYRRRKVITDLLTRIACCAYPFHKPSGPGEAILMLDDCERKLLKSCNENDFQMKR